MSNKKFCMNCGTQLDINAAFCPQCGTKFNEMPNNPGQNNQNSSSSSGNTIQNSNNGTNNNQNGPGGVASSVKERNVGLCILFSIITCGIYGIYWMIKLNDETNALTGHPEATSGGLVFLFSLITCGIYTFYWYYQMGKRYKMYYAERNSVDCSEAPILYLLLGLLVPGIGSMINYCLIQSNINKLARQN